MTATECHALADQIEAHAKRIEESILSDTSVVASMRATARIVRFAAEQQAVEARVNALLNSERLPVRP